MYRITRTYSYKKNVMYAKINTVTIKNEKSMLTIKDMPRPKRWPIIGTKLDFLAAGSGTKLHEYIDYRHKQLGPIFCENIGSSTELVFISDPGLMKTLFHNLDGKYPAHLLPDPWVLYEKLYGSKRGLFFMNGEEWLSNRRIMNKHLLKVDSEKWLQDPVTETIEKFLQKWKTRAAQGSFNPNLESEFYRFSTDVIISILLGSDSFLKPSKHHEMLLVMFSESVKKIFQTTTKLYGLPIRWCQRLNLQTWKDFKECVDMSLFLAQKIVGEMLNKRHLNTGLIKRLYDESVSDDIITRIVADFVIAAGDTTAYTTLWILFLLSKNENMAKELRIKTDRSYVKHVVKESMRLYPVAPFLTRILTKDGVLGLYKLKEGTPVIASVYTSGRDEQNFSKAEEFLPYRWDRNDLRKANLTNHVPSATLPFALGARSCIGKKIAMLQITELIYQIVQHFDLRCINNTEVKAITSQVLVPNKDIDISVSLLDRKSEK